MTSPAEFWRRVAARKLVQWTLGYLAAAWVMVQALDVLGGHFGWPELVFRVATVFLAAGVLPVVVLAWYHGERGSQRVTGPELLVLAGVLLLAALVTGYVARGHGLSSTADRASIVVLPCANVGGRVDDEYFSDGLTEELIGTLDRVRGLRVISRTSSYAYKGRPVDVRALARELNVRHVLECGVQREGGRVRVNARLADGGTGSNVWSERYDRELKDVFAIEDEISGAVADALRVRLVDAAGARVRSRIAGDLDAHDLYLRGRYAANTLSERGLRESLELYRRALAEDPRYALAYVGVADAYFWLADNYMPSAEAYVLVKEAVDSALALDPSLAEAHALLGAYHFAWTLDFAAAEQEERRAIALNPNLALAWSHLAFTMNMEGRRGEVVPAIDRALALDPKSAFMNWSRGQNLYYAQQYAAAIQQHRRTVALDSTFYYFDCYGCAAYRELGMFDSAVAAYALATRRSGLALPPFGLGITYARMGRRAEAGRIVAELAAASRRHWVAPEQIAMIWANLGESDSAFAWLEQGLRIQSAWKGGLKMFPEFDSIRGDPRYASLARRIYPVRGR